MKNHPETQIISYWFPKDAYLKNIPQPSIVYIDVLQELSKIYPNIFIQVEPETIEPRIKKYLLENGDKYDIIYTFDKDILDKYKNTRKYVYGTSWIKKEYYNNININNKEFKISTLCGSKKINNSKGHILRQILYHKQDIFDNYPITFFRSSAQHPHLPEYKNNPFINSNDIHNDKIPLFDKFQFSIVIENSKQENYFTEKLMDCLITKTIPIYWGCPNISDYFDTTGWIIFETTDLNELVNKLSILDITYYNNYIDIINKNYEKAQQYIDIVANLNNYEDNTL